MTCKCGRYQRLGKRNVIEAPAPRQTVEHSPIHCWSVTHGPQPVATGRLVRDRYLRVAWQEAEQTPVSVMTIA